MQMLLATLELGGSGATMPPPGAEIARQVIDAFVAGDYRRAAQIQRQFALFPSKWTHRGLPVFIDGEIVGGIGLSSGTAEQDRVCAEAAIQHFYVVTGNKA